LILSTLISFFTASQSAHFASQQASPNLQNHPNWQSSSPQQSLLGCLCIIILG